ncbi:hypothetical protein XM25_21335 [Devosia sp. H5989]|nr:hypothetical protein XM25_21335 [Devosia sp. H5989]
MAETVGLEAVEAALTGELNRQAALRGEPLIVGLIDVAALAKAVVGALGLQTNPPNEGLVPEELDASNDG